MGKTCSPVEEYYYARSDKVAVHLCRLSVSTDKSRYSPGEQMEAVALLEYLDLDGSWKPLPNMAINMCIDSQCTQVPTDSSGRARWVTSAPEKPGTYTLKAEFPGA